VHLYLCEEVLDRMVDSLLEQVRACYKTSGLPDLVSVGKSGKEFIARLRKRLAPSENAQLTVHDIELGEKGKTIQDRNIDALANRSILVCDSIVNSGATLRNARQHFLARGAKEVRTLTAVLREGAEFIPNFSAMTVGKRDEVFFGLPHYPVPTYAKGCVRALQESDRGVTIDTDAKYMDPHLEDYVYHASADPNYKAFVVEPVDSSTPVGIVAFRLEGNGHAFIDAWLVSKVHEGQGYGSALMRFFDNYTRGAGLQGIRMLAIQEEVPRYERMGYVATSRKVQLACGTFIEMKRSTSN
jgi:hypoxanthine-guanine phosphoribosyltransferase/GNAT superfamily N-acetyltransferase